MYWSNKNLSAQPAGAIEYTNFISRDRRDLHPLNKCPGYNIKPSDGEAPVMLEPWGTWSTLSLPSLPGPLKPRVVAADRVLSMGQIELFDHLTVCKQINDA